MPFQFLDLSAGKSVSKSSGVDTVLTLFSELRNRIYTHVSNAVEFDCEPDEYLALTQICQAIRAESRPIFMRRPVRPCGCVAWLRAFFPGWDDSSADKPTSSQICMLDQLPSVSIIVTLSLNFFGYILKHLT
jgi:hypothetical protein